MHLLIWVLIVLGFSLLLLFGILSVLQDLFAHEPNETPLIVDRDANVIAPQYRHSP
jgi:TRAP-type mannitol/chloroaromatic compound transport system permease small subunit